MRSSRHHPPALVDEALVLGLKCRISDMQGRLERLQDRASKRRTIASDVMVELNLKKLNGPRFHRLDPRGDPRPDGDQRGRSAEHLLAAGEPRLKRQRIGLSSNRGPKLPVLPCPIRNRC